MNTELAARLIEKDDTKRLERLMRSNKKVHGEMNSLYDLALAFLRCNRVSQAKKVLEVGKFYVCIVPTERGARRPTFKINI